MKRYRQYCIRSFIQTTILNQYQYHATLLSEINRSYQGFVFRELSIDDFYKDTLFKEKDRLPRYIKYLNQGHRCYGFESLEGSIASYFWLTVGEENRLLSNPAFKGFNWFIAKNEACIWDCRSAPAYRRQGLYRQGLQYLVYFCQERKIDKIMINCRPDNVASNLGIRSAGFQLKGTIVTLKTRLFKLIFVKGRLPKILTFSESITTRDLFP